MLAIVLLSYAGFSIAQQTSTPAARSHASAGSSEAALAKKADAAREADQTDEAIRLYKQLVAIRPDSPEYWWYLGMLYYEADQYTEGQAAFHHVTGLKPDMSLGWAMLGLCEFETKKYDRALAHLERADVLKIPRQEAFYDVARYHLALLLIRSGEFELAATVLTEFARDGKEGVQFTEAMGLAALRKPLLPSELPPTERELVMDVGHAFTDAAGRRPDDTQRDIADLLKKYPNTPEIHYLIGNMVVADDPDRALDQWKAELNISPHHPLALVNIAKEYMKRGDYKSAQPYAKKAVSAHPEFFVGHAILGELLTEGNIDVNRGIHELEIAERLAPAQPQVHFALGSAYVKAGRKQDAERERAEFLRLRSSSK